MSDKLALVTILDDVYSLILNKQYINIIFDADLEVSNIIIRYSDISRCNAHKNKDTGTTTFYLNEYRFNYEDNDLFEDMYGMLHKMSDFNKCLKMHVD